MERFGKSQNIGEGAIAASIKPLTRFHATHWHEFYEIEYVLSGEGDYCIDGKHYPMGAGMLFFMTPLNFHSVDTKDCRVVNVMFSERLCDGVLLARWLATVGCQAVALQGESRQLLEALLCELAQSGSDERYASGLMNAILGKLVQKLKITLLRAPS